MFCSVLILSRCSLSRQPISHHLPGESWCMYAYYLLSRVQLFVTPQTVAHQTPLSMGFSRQEYWSGLPFPSLGDLPNPGIEPGSPTFQADALTSKPPGRLDINCKKKKTIRNTNTQTLNNTFLNNQHVTEEIKREIKKFLETNDNENMTTQNLWDAAKAILRGKFIAIQSYLKKLEKSQTDNLTLHLKQLEKEKQENPKISRRKEIIKIRAEINEKKKK